MFRRLTSDRPVDPNLRSGPQVREYERLADRVAASSPGRTLDWGCGYGKVTRLLVDRGVETESFEWDARYPEPTVVPIPHFPELNYTRSAETVRLPYEDDRFDTVIGSGVLEHVHRPEESLDELRRILKPGGRLFIIKLPNRYSYLELIARRSGRMYYHGAHATDTIYTVDSARAILERHGFRVDRVALSNLLPLTFNTKVDGPVAEAVWHANVALSRVPGLRGLATNVDVDAVALR